MSGLALVTAARAQETCTTAECHAALLAKPSVHAAAESCDTCHEPVATPHPQAGQKTFRLTQAQPGLCADCHDLPAAAFEHGPVAAGDCTSCHDPHAADQKALLAEPADRLCFGCHGDVEEALAKQHVHAAVEDGCTSCHQPHGSGQPKLLAEALPALCTNCHSDVGDTLASATVTHPPVGDRSACVSCHSPHAADQPALLVKSERELCLGCHGGALTSQMTVLHRPIAEGKCTPCHSTHGGRHAKLLVADFPAGPYVPYTATAFELCFQCHKRDLLQYPDTSFATGFRDGERNLHFLHVNDAQKGRSCALCHAPHGAAEAGLIAASVQFGQWQLPLRYVKTPTGGSCAPGCHKPYSYDREVAGRKPPAPPAGGGPAR